MATELGRLVKKNDKLIETIEVEGYSWLSFNERSHIYPDNARKSVLMSEFHDPEDLASKVRAPKSFFDKFQARTSPLVPVDLQKDYVLSQREMLIKKRRRMLDEEEAIAEELAELVLEEEEMKAANQWTAQHAQENAAKEASAAPVVPASGNAPVESAVAHHPASHQPIEHATTITPGTHPAGTQVAGHHHAAHAHATAAELEILKEQARSRGFEEGRQEGFDLGFRDGHEQGASEGADQGNKEGFQSGYKDGEGKGLLAAESKTQTFFQKIGESVSEIENLRSEVLAAGQEIFIEIAKIASEKLLRTQIANDPATLKNIYLHALDTYRDREFVTFEMNPQDAKRLKEQLKDEGTAKGEHLPKIKIRENSEMASGDFKMEVDSELAVHDLKKSIDALIDEMGGQIFTNNKKVDKVS